MLGNKVHFARSRQNKKDGVSSLVTNVVKSEDVANKKVKYQKGFLVFEFVVVVGTTGIKEKIEQPCIVGDLHANLMQEQDEMLVDAAFLEAPIFEVGLAPLE